MVSLNTPRDAILYQNMIKSVILIDIPRSISLAQGTCSHPYTSQIFSSSAPEKPYPSTEPKTEAAKVRVMKRMPQDISMQFPTTLLEQALQDISKGTHRAWYLERKLLPHEAERQSKKRKAREERSETKSYGAASSARKVSSELTEKPDLTLGSFLDPIDLSAYTKTDGASTCPYLQRLTNRLYYNPCSYPLALKHAESDIQLPTTYTIPPHLGFFLSKINQTTAPAMSMAALKMYPEPSASAGRGQFDLILLDPPWENRSVRRAARYSTMRVSDPMEALQSMLGQHMAPNGIVACWITNKASIRDAALECFEVWDVELIEEWAWLKVTTNGEPVTEIDGLWRKPYEILLVGRKRYQDSEKLKGDLKRKVIVGVPDLHSRKPNLKALIEPLLPAEYRALEIFARHLTAGWWAWGNEVLKYAVVQG